MSNVLRGEIFWPCLRKPNDLSGKIQYDLGNMDADSLKLLKAHGIPTKTKGDDRGAFITVKGSPEYPPKVMDSQRNPLSEPVSLGNGTKVKVPFKTYEWTFKGKSGTGVGIGEIMVLKMVTYQGSGDGDDALAEEDGYVSAAAQPSELTAEDLDDEVPF
jgi:hypothetical protein